MSIPAEKIQRAIVSIDKMLGNKKRKATVLNIQKLAGFLNFLCHCIVPGRAFTRRLYSLTSSSLKAHHDVRIPDDVRLDLVMWKEFLHHPSAYCRPFLDYSEWTAEEILLYTDSSKSAARGCGGFCMKDWFCEQWPEGFIENFDPSIEYLELFAVIVGVILWIKRFQNRRIRLFCDNLSVVQMINSSSSRCKNCMTLIRIITLEGMRRNVRVYAKHVTTDKNILADALSRLQMERFWRNTPEGMSPEKTEIPCRLWPVQKLWLHRCHTLRVKLESCYNRLIYNLQRESRTDRKQHQYTHQKTQFLAAQCPGFWRN